jgi:hypothetical protein
MLRNPVDMVRSWHGNLIYNGDEDIENLEPAWRAQAERARGLRVPAHMQGREWKLQYRDVCALGQQVARVIEKVPREQLSILFLDDLISDREGFHRHATAFLGVDYHPASSERVVNPSKRNRSLQLARFMRWSKFINHPGIRKLAPVFDKIGFHPLRLIRLANEIPRENPEISPAFREELCESLKPEIDLLEALLDRPLDAWRAH